MTGRRVGRSGWSVDVPDGWSVDEVPGNLTLARADGGTIQLSSVSKHGEHVSGDDLRGFVDMGGDDWGEASPSRCGDFSGFAYHYAAGGRQWKRWFLHAGGIVLFATYDGTPAAARDGLPRADAIVDSARHDGDA